MPKTKSSPFRKKNKKSRFRPFHALWRSVRHVATVLGFLLLISLIIGLFSSYYLLNKTAPSLPEEFVLFYRVDGAMPEGPETGGLQAALGPRKLKLAEATAALDRAATDPRVKSLIFSIRKSDLSMSQIQELRQAVLDFREESGKPAYVFSVSYAEAGQGLPVYTLASAFDEIWMQPLGMLSVNGMQLEQPFARDLLDRIGINPEFFQREAYKGLFDSLTKQEMTEAMEESMGDLLISVTGSLINDILGAREDMAETADFQALVNQGLFTDKEALDNGLVDRLDYGDTLLKYAVAEDVGEENIKQLEEPPMVGLGMYYSARAYQDFQAEQEKPAKDNAVRDSLAVIYVQGPIMILSEEESQQGLLGSTGQSADEIASLITEAGRDGSVKSIVLRVDSPGGSPSASELIRRAIERVDKPVIVSMGQTAASGGYWVSAPADHIFALPTTLTGSIGVAGGKVSLKEMWSNIDVNWDSVSIGENAGMYSLNQPFSESQEERINAMMDRTYNAFLKIVAEGRDMSISEAREVAQGRVWSGKDAMRVGLVDQMGGLNAALDYAAETAGYDSREDMNLITLPVPKTLMEQVMELLGQSVAISPFLQWQSSVMSDVDAMIGDDVRALQSRSPVMVYDSLPRQ